MEEADLGNDAIGACSLFTLPRLVSMKHGKRFTGISLRRQKLVVDEWCFCRQAEGLVRRCQTYPGPYQIFLWPFFLFFYLFSLSLSYLFWGLFVLSLI